MTFLLHPLTKIYHIISLTHLFTATHSLSLSLSLSPSSSPSPSPSPSLSPPFPLSLSPSPPLSLFRDFGYVARDQVTKKHKCHVFRCEMPARAVAKALLENHQKLSKTPPTTTPVTTATTASSDEGVKGSEPTKEEAGERK